MRRSNVLPLRGQTGDPPQLLIVMVGLPARGKSYLARRLLRYMSWLGCRSRVFNVGDYRRRMVGAPQGPEFFDPANPEGRRLRRVVAEAALRDAIAFMSAGGQVAIYDATNSTRARREWLLEQVRPHGLPVVFVESVTEDPGLIAATVREKERQSPDFTGMDADTAVRDFRARLAHYQTVYETVEEDVPAIRLFDVNRQVVANRIQGFLPSHAVYLLMNIHLARRPIMLTRHGESEDNAAGRIGGDAPLTVRGREYAGALAAWVAERFADRRPPVVWTSTLRRTRETAAALGLPTVEWRTLDEIEAGMCDGLTYEEIAERHPDEYAARHADKLTYRYPRGESYLDVVERLQPLIIELERQKEPVLVVAHQAVSRVLYAYFVHQPLERAPYLQVPLHTVFELTPTSFGCDEHRHTLGEAIHAPS